MSFVKTVFPLIGGLFAGSQSKAGETSVSHLLHFATATVEHELSKLILKIALALVATGVLIFSLIMLGRLVNDSLQYYERGPIYSGVFFGAVSVVCFVGLFKLFKAKNPPPQALDSLASESPLHHMAEKIFLNFFEGLNTGLNQVKQTGPVEKVVVIEDDDLDLREINMDDYKHSDFKH